MERDDFVVNSKKTLIKKVLLFFGIFFIVGCHFSGLAGAYGESKDDIQLISESSESAREIRRGRKFGDILCEERVKIFPEEKFVDNSGAELYSRTVEIGKEFKRHNEDTVKVVASHTSKIKFTYDKKTFVKICDPDKDVEENETGNSWSVMDVKEIFPGDDQCLVSTRCVLYKENRLRVKEYVLSSHYDVMCSVGGQIGINTDLH